MLLKEGPRIGSDKPLRQANVRRVHACYDKPSVSPMIIAATLGIVLAALLADYFDGLVPAVICGCLGFVMTAPILAKCA